MNRQLVLRGLVCVWALLALAGCKKSETAADASAADDSGIVVLDKGRIAGVGTHEILLETNELYADIYFSQLVDDVSSNIESAASQESEVPA